MSKKLVSLFAFSVWMFAIVVLTQCTNDKPEDIAPIECETDGLTYDNGVKSIIDANCASSGCHGGARSPRLTTYAEVTSSLDRVEQRALKDRDMPPSSPLGSCSSEKLQAWIDAGAPEN